MSQSSRLPSERRRVDWWAVIVGIWLAAMIIAGGTSAPSTLAFAVQTIASAAIFLIALIRLRSGFPTWLAGAGLAFILASALVVLFQLVPLPPGIWQALPGRSLIAETYGLTGQTIPWLPLSLSPDATLQSAMAFVPVAAAFAAVASLNSHSLSYVAAAVTFSGLVCVLFAVAQKFGGQGSIFYLYEGASGAIASGTFANRNFAAGLMYATIPFIAALASYVEERWHQRPWLTMLFAAVYVGLMLVGLAVVGSRTGVVLAMLSVFLTFAFVLRTGRAAGSGTAVIATLVGLFIVGQTSMLGLMRLASRDPLEDFRATIFSVSRTGATAFFPAGSGFGSFSQAYQMFETPSTIIDAYVNHAHNDWLELVFEGGAPAALLILLFLVLFAIGVFRLFRFTFTSRSGAMARAGAIVVLLMLLHAIVDFGLRTPALMSVFAASLGAMTLAGSRLAGHESGHGHGRRSHSRPSREPQPVTPLAPRPFVPGTFGNKPKTRNPGQQDV